MKIVTGHQPAYLPWLGLFHKASLADVFVYMDDVQYLVRDWNNRNVVVDRQGQAIWLTVPVDLKNSKSLCLKDIVIVNEGVPSRKSWQHKHWMTLKSLYGREAFFQIYEPFFTWFYRENTWTTLAQMNLVLLQQFFKWFGIKAEIVVASEQVFTGKKSDLVLNHGQKLKADVVVTGMHGKDYIDQAEFKKNGIEVVFQEYIHPEEGKYLCGGKTIYAACIDVLFKHGPESQKICLGKNLSRQEIER